METLEKNGKTIYNAHCQLEKHSKNRKEGMAMCENMATRHGQEERTEHFAKWVKEQFLLSGEIQEGLMLKTVDKQWLQLVECVSPYPVQNSWVVNYAPIVGIDYDLFVGLMNEKLGIEAVVYHGEVNGHYWCKKSQRK